MNLPQVVDAARLVARIDAGCDLADHQLRDVASLVMRDALRSDDAPVASTLMTVLSEMLAEARTALDEQEYDRVRSLLTDARAVSYAASVIGGYHAR